MTWIGIVENSPPTQPIEEAINEGGDNTRLASSKDRIGQGQEEKDQLVKASSGDTARTFAT